MLKENFIEFIESSIIKNWDFKALSDYQGETLSYSEIACHIALLHQAYRELGIKQGDKIALIGKNSARWGTIYISIVSYGAVLVPILPDFKPDDLHEIVNHSDSILLFVSNSIGGTLTLEKMPNLTGMIAIDDYAILKSKSLQLNKAFEHIRPKLPAEKEMIKKENFSLPHIPNQNLALISYTSGTTGFVKGVMLSHNSLAANIRYAQRNMPLNPGDQIVSFLPLAHAFGAAFEFLFPFSLGCHITILTKTPSPQIIMKAFQEVRPALILSVPLVIEKIYKNKLLPVLQKWHMKMLLKVPGINNVLYKTFRKKLTEVFGGNFREIVIGGAPLNKEAEAFFRKMKFPFTVGYGMTECGPLISYEGWKKFVSGSSGKVVDTLEIKIDSEDPLHLTGEILVRGDNVLMGYYKNEELTRKMIDEDGWLHTGDIGVFDKEGNIHIKGRSKSMILGSNGKNIYPEEIEAIFDNRFAVAESLIVHRNNKLVALIYPDYETVAKQKISQEQLMDLFESHKNAINMKLPSYMNVATVEVRKEEFIKTPKKSIKRYLYN